VITINLLRSQIDRGRDPASDKAFQQVLCKTQLGPRRAASHFPLQSPPLPPSLHPALQERLLGKSPLRLVSDRAKLFPGCWRETLACGHSVDTFQTFLWDENAHMILLEPTAKRRRCPECKAIADFEASLASPKKPVQSVRLPDSKRGDRTA
jgi:hypothetical protein